MAGWNKGCVARTADNPIFLDAGAKNEIKRQAKKWYKKCQSRGIDDAKEIEDYEGDLYILWCECCIKHKDNPVEFVMNEFKRNSEWRLKNYIRDYFNFLDGSPEKGPEPFNPNFYKFVDLYRSGMKIKDLALEYQVSEKTISNYISDNFVTKEQINPLEYLEVHAKVRGKDHEYWNLNSKILSEIDFS